MPNHRLTALVAVVLSIFALFPAPTLAQYTEGLPPGIVNVEVDGQPIDAITVPATSNTTPVISGRVEPGGQAIELAIANGEVVRFPAKVDERGRFRTSVLQPILDG